MSARVEVVEPTGAEWALWREVRLRSLQDSPSAFGSTYERELGFTEDTWRRRLDDPDSLSVLARDDDVALGIGGGFQDLPGLLHVVAMWVDPRRRGQGVAHLLLQGIEAWAGERGLRLHLDVSVSNPAARRCYERYGFVATGGTRPIREDSSELTERMVLARDSGSPLAGPNGLGRG